jgi:ABC-2 type transport system ATP-binding protein
VSGRSELQLQCRLYGMNARQARERADELIRMLELESCADRRTDTYSGGQKRRLDIGIGLAHRPRLLFLDEPTTGLNPQVRARMWSEVKRLRDDGTTIFLTTHYLEEADALCDRAGNHRPRSHRLDRHAGRAQAPGGGRPGDAVRRR